MSEHYCGLNIECKVTTCTKYNMGYKTLIIIFILFYFIDPVYSTKFSLSNFYVISSFAHLKYQQTLTENTINYQYNIVLIIFVH